MSLPSASDYNSVVQSPRTAFLDRELQIADVETGAFGLPFARAGGFVVTYHLTSATGNWAVRCFTRDIPDQKQRYAAIDRHLRTVPKDHFIDFKYIEQGVRVLGKTYPIVKMEWIEGQTLGAYLNANHASRDLIAKLETELIRAMDCLEQHSIAHGDFQLGNLMVTDSGRLMFIDYDSMWVPGIGPRKSITPGHPNYVSPLRSDEDFGPHIDRFSAIIAFIALRALRRRPELWEEYSGGGENLLFTRLDFVDPNNSALIADLESIDEVRPVVERLRPLLRTPLEQIPSLNDFLRGQVADRPAVQVSLAGRRVALHEHLVVEATNRDEILRHEGEVLQIVGRITEARLNYTNQKVRRPYYFLNFDDWTKASFRIIIWSQALQRFRNQGLEPKDLEGKWVSVTKLVSVRNHGTYGPMPQIAVEGPHDIRVMRDESEARELLERDVAVIDVDPLLQPEAGSPGPFESTIQAPSDGLDPITQRNTEIINRIQRLHPRVDARPKPISSPSPQSQAAGDLPPPGSPMSELVVLPGNRSGLIYQAYSRKHGTQREVVQEVAAHLRACWHIRHPSIDSDPDYQRECRLAQSDDEKLEVFARRLVDLQLHWDKGRLGSAQDRSKSANQGQTAAVAAASPPSDALSTAVSVPSSASTAEPPPGSPFHQARFEPPDSRMKAYQAFSDHRWNLPDAARHVAEALRDVTVVYPVLERHRPYQDDLVRAINPDSRRRCLAKWLVRWQAQYESKGKIDDLTSDTQSRDWTSIGLLEIIGFTLGLAFAILLITATLFSLLS